MTTTSAVSALLTDRYQLTMLKGYFDRGMYDVASFEFFVRTLPRERGFLIAAGLEQTLDYLEQLQFTPQELEWLAGPGGFAKAFVDHLAGWRFTGDVYAMPEGTVCFANEPLLRITAPIMEAQLVESRLINILHFQTLIASKAARCVLAAPEKVLVDFGMRRAHGAEAGLLAARASYLAGFDGTATVLAEKLFGIPSFGTMAHSFIQAHDDEVEAFYDFARCHPQNVVLLIDTYDTEGGARRVVELAPRLRAQAIAIKAVRLDSGDLNQEARRVRAILDAGGLADVDIFCSGNLDEYQLQDLLAQGAPIDGFGIGTRLDVSSDVPYLDCAYKLQEYAGRPRRKRSPGKVTLPGRKQVYRHYSPDDGRMIGDVLTLTDDQQEGQALLQPVMRGGRRLESPLPLGELRERVRAQVARLPNSLRQLRDAPAYPLTISDDLQALVSQVIGAGG
jgi:nicotinate phosphoribosyltransferase